ncbi:transcriptional regulator [Mergibacter septicus]|uniref:Transcriptional regulator n=1 Tax=Mergibacter septicus TaxID=221402 RepID=A0A8E3MFL4_9PAST|nr:HTH-type transcriptional regulator UlaR [Mergibacter septicus]AWX15081.1 transcriptional regulator [Mergibacter septicus]QDJ12599.1 transcriptional regulator [Mergibacter septicus]QDJ14334.1 transcriptional regulator [Mergibacter septicus]UTU48225.1 HTH-type transcriptional regulator UlaR [Mergibacter septicus]WMR96157.1 HTH-type transcriptional regulator UlaR [Mergibacter septicus]
MNKDYRQKQLLNLLGEKQVLSTAEIVNSLGISPATARRDITELDTLGLLKKVRNGVEAVKQGIMTSGIKDHRINNIDEKQKIANVATEICRDGESIFLTCGSTMLMLAKALCGRKVQIITNYLPLANYVIEHDHDDVVIMGGQYNKNQAITLALDTNTDAMYSANIMFTSGKGITKNGLYKTDMLIANSEQRMLSRVEKLIVLLDSSKLGKQAGMLFTSLEHIDLLITDKAADPKIIEELRAKGLKIILA